MHGLVGHGRLEYSEYIIHNGVRVFGGVSIVGGIGRPAKRPWRAAESDKAYLSTYSTTVPMYLQYLCTLYVSTVL